MAAEPVPENRTCSIHEKILEYYCTEDTACICASCSLTGEHRGHQVETLDEASEEKKKKTKLRNVLQKLTTQKTKAEKRVHSLEEQCKEAQERLDGEEERVRAWCADIRRQLDDLEKRERSKISMQVKKIKQSLSDVIQEMEVKKDKLSRKMRHMEELCNTTDPLTVLQDSGDLCDPEEGGGDEDMEDSSDSEKEECDEDKWGYNRRYRLVELISNISHTLSDMIRRVLTFYVQDPADILLDINTDNNHILISDDRKAATWSATPQNRQTTAARFQNFQVMSSNGFTLGRHYWDVEISGSWRWVVGVCYPSIDKKGAQSYIGDYSKSWGLYSRDNNQYSAIYGGGEIQLPHQISNNRFRTCLDYEAGELSFYELCDPIRHLHTFTATFTEPLHVALYIWGGGMKILRGVAAARKKTSLETDNILGSRI